MRLNSIAEVNSALEGMTMVKRLDFSVDLSSGRCSSVLELVDDDHRPRNRIVLNIDGVNELKIRGFGGGITQVKCLRVKDVSEMQHDRIKFLFEDLEEQALFLKCETWTAEEASIES